MAFMEIIFVLLLTLPLLSLAFSLWKMIFVLCCGHSRQTKSLCCGFHCIFFKRSTLYSRGFSDDSLTNRKKIIFIKACRVEKKNTLSTFNSKSVWCALCTGWHIRLSRPFCPRGIQNEEWMINDVGKRPN